MKKQRVRIVNETGSPLNTQIMDADTGDVIHGVTSFALSQDGAHDEIVAVLSFVAEIDVTVEGEVRRYRLDQDTGEIVPLDEESLDHGADREKIRAVLAVFERHSTSIPGFVWDEVMPLLGRVGDEVVM